MRAAQLYIKETGKYIQLGMDSDFPFTLSKSIAEIQDVSKRNKTFSKSFKIPATEDNVKALGYPHVIGTDLDAVNVYKQQCFIIVNGNVIDDGYVYILKARRDTDAIEFECQFVGGNEAWVVALQSLKMSEVVSNTSGAGLTVTYTDANIRARYNTDPTTLVDPSYIFMCPYMYMFSDRAAGPPREPSDGILADAKFRDAKGKDFWPAFRVDYLVDAIFGTATNPLVQSVFGFDSFELDSDFFTNNATHGFWNNIYYSDRSEDEYPNVTFNGSASNWGNFLPQDVSMLDFFMKLVRTFNLVFSFDGITLKVEPRQAWKSWNGTTYDGFYSGDIDWSEKVSVSQEIQYKTSNYKRQIRLTYEQDSYPLNGQQYPFLEDDMVSQPEVRYIVDTENNNQEGITDIVLPFNFSPCKFYQGRFDIYRQDDIYDQLDFTVAQGDASSFQAEFKYANRLFVFKVGSKPTGVEAYTGTSNPTSRTFTKFLLDPRWRNWSYQDAGGTVYFEDEYPFIYNCMTINPYSGTNIVFGATSVYAVFTDADLDEPLSVDVTDVTVTRDASNSVTNVESNSIDDINLGIYKSNTIDMPDGLYERFWKTTIDQLITTRTLVTQVLMTRNEFVSLDISKYYTLMGQRFILNKVKDFDPMLDEQMVEVELLAVDAFRSSEEIEPPAPTLLLDLYGDDIEAAYSLRKLRAGYTGAAIRVRRTPDNTEQDIGFDSNGDLDTSALTTFVGSGSAHIQTWYDQSTNANHAVQNTSGQQPHIVYNGTIKTHGGKPAVTQDSDLGNPSNQFLDLTSTVNAVHNFIVFYQPAIGGGRAYYAESATKKVSHDGFRIDYEDGVNPRIDGVTNIRTDYVLSEVKVLSGTATSIINGSSDASGTANVLQIEALMGNPTAGGGIVARMQEMLFFSADKSSDASDIEDNLNTYYTIF